MKKLLIISAILMVICPVCLNSQNNQSKLNQGEFMNNFYGTWYSGNGKDTINVFEMHEYNNAVLQIGSIIIMGVKKIQFTCTYTWDPKTESYKGYTQFPGGQTQTWRVRSLAENQTNFELVKDLTTNEVLQRRTTIFTDPDHITVNFFNQDNVQIGTSKLVRTSASMTLPKPDANVDQLALMQLMVGQWRGYEGKDKEYYSEVIRDGNIFTDHTYNVIKGEKTLKYTQNIIYSEKEGRFRSFAVYPNGNYTTYIATFNSDKKWIGSFLRDFDPDQIIQNWEIDFSSPGQMFTTLFSKDGSKAREIRWNKVE